MSIVVAFKDGEALEPGSSIAAVARRHGLNAYLGFKWIRCAREGWLDLQRALAKERADLAPAVAAPTFVPVKLFELSAGKATPAPPPSNAVHEAGSRAAKKRGAMGSRLPNGARLSLDADVDAETLRRVLSALGDL